MQGVESGAGYAVDAKQYKEEYDGVSVSMHLASSRSTPFGTVVVECDHEHIKC